MGQVRQGGGKGAAGAGKNRYIRPGSAFRELVKARRALCRRPDRGGGRAGAVRARGDTMFSRRREGEAAVFLFAHQIAFTVSERRASGCGFQGC